MKRILVIRLSAIGDVVMASALIPPLRRRWPQAHLAWLAEPPAAPLLQHNPRLDEVIVWPRGEWLRLWRERRYLALAREVGRFRRRLREGRFDLVLDTQGLLKSGLLAWWTGARERVGLGAKEGSRHLMTRVVGRDVDDPRIASEYRHLAASLGLEAAPFAMDVEPGEAARHAARRLLEEAGVTGEYAAICPFTTRPQKHWFAARWRELVGRIEGELLLPVVMLGGPGDRAAAAEIAAGTAVRNLVGRCDLDTAAALIGGAQLLIGVDTGLTHMGVAFDRPTVALFGSTRPYLQTPSPRAEVLYEPLPCSPCRRRPTCGGAFTCMARHTAQSVLEGARRVREARR